MTAFGYEKGQLPANPAAFLSDKQLADLADEIAQSQGQNVKRGLICSGDSFINSEEKIAQIKADFPQCDCGRNGSNRDCASLSCL